MFYVYEHMRLDTNAVFYVGKGCGGRVRSKDKRNKHWHAIVDKAGYSGRLIAESNDEELIFLAEEERIDQLKRIGLSLANKTAGGDGGLTGYQHTEHSRQKISDAHKERYKIPENHPRYGVRGSDNPWYGRKQSSEARLGMSVNASMKRPEVVAKISGEKSLLAKSVEYEGVVYKTMNDLAKHLGISSQALRSRIFRGQADKYGYKVLGKTQNLAPLQSASA